MVFPLAVYALGGNLLLCLEFFLAELCLVLAAAESTDCHCFADASMVSEALAVETSEGFGNVGAGLKVPPDAQVEDCWSFSCYC